LQLLLIAAVGLLSYANGANDNFKGVATVWGAGRTSYWRALCWATAFTFLGSLAAIGTASGLISKFNGSNFVAADVYMQVPFLAAVAVGGAATVLLASRLGLPISTTHALTGALVGVGVTAAGFSGVRFVALGSGVLLPLLFSPIVALALTLSVYPLMARLARSRDCVCVEDSRAVALAPDGAAAMESIGASAVVRVARASECNTGAEVVRGSVMDILHWLSAAGISFARGLNDTPKIAAVLLVAASAAVKLEYALVAVAMAMGGMLGAARVAQTMSKQITPMATEEAVGANLVAASLVTLASFFALPVSTTHVTSGSIFGIGWRRRHEADWKRVGNILLSWAGTLPLGAALGGILYLMLVRLA
jgi:PiT family inorganic phosphate transporter